MGITPTSDSHPPSMQTVSKGSQKRHPTFPPPLTYSGSSFVHYVWPSMTSPYKIYAIKPVSYTHLDVYKRQVPEEVQVPKRVVDEEEEAEVEERNYFVGTIQEDKNASVDTELPNSKRTSWLNPEAEEFVPVFPSRFVRDPDPVTSPSPVEINLVIAHEPGQLDSRVEDVEDVVVAEGGQGVESTEEAEERSAVAAQEGIVVGVRETVESEVADGHRDVRAASVSEVVDGQGDVHAASVVEVSEVEVEEKFGGSVVECASVVCEDV